VSRGFLAEQQSPFHDFLDLEATKLGEGRVEVRAPFRPEFLRATDSDMIHGGIISALIDIAGDYAVASVLGGGVPTIDLRVDYLRPALRTDLVAKATAVKVGRTVAVADVELFDGEGRLVAVGRGAYSAKVG
jgi:uncharacterized protein (TIGR00369 family)